MCEEFLRDSSTFSALRNDASTRLPASPPIANVSVSSHGFLEALSHNIREKVAMHPIASIHGFIIGALDCCDVADNYITDHRIEMNDLDVRAEVISSSSNDKPIGPHSTFHRDESIGPRL